MFSKKYKNRISELEMQLKNSEKVTQEYRKANIRLAGRVKQLTKELETLPKRNSKGQYEKRQQGTLTA